MRFIRTCVAAALLLVCGPAVANFAIFQTYSSSGTGGAFLPLKIGAGGFVTNIVISSDGHQFARTDTGGGFVRAAFTSPWAAALTSSSMPGTDATPAAMFGVCAIAIAPSNTNHLYMYWAQDTGSANPPGHIFSSTNFAGTWVRTTAQPLSSPTCNANGSSSPNAPQLSNEYLGVSPANENVVYFGSPSSGVAYSLNGGTSWTAISTGTIPAATSSQGNLIYFDPSDATGNTVYISSYSNGIWKCTSATTSPSCSELNSTGMPTTFKTVYVDQAGTLWVVDQSGTNGGQLLRYLSGTWSVQLTTSNDVWTGVAVDPANSSYVAVAGHDGALAYSNNGQAGSPTWTFSSTFSVASTVVPWQQWKNDGSLSLNNVVFDPSQSHALYGGNGDGVYKTTPPTSGTPSITWNANETAGVENLDLTNGYALSGGGVAFSAQDRPLWYITNPNVYPSQYWPNNNTTIRYGANLCGNATANTYAGLNAQDGFTVSTTGPTGTYSTSGTSGLPSGFSGQSGFCAILTSTNWIWMGTPSSLFEPYFTNNSGSSWSACTFGGGKTASGGGWRFLSQDSTAPGTILLYNDGTGSGNGAGALGFWESTSTTACAFTQVDTTTPDNGGQRLVAIPGQACNFVFASLADPHGTLPGTGSLYLTQNCGSTWSAAISNVSSVLAFGTGAPNPAKDGYPAIYCQCYANDGSGSKFGFFEIDNLDTVTSPVITNLLASGFPAGNFDNIVFIAGDLAIYGTIYGGFSDSGGFYRTLH